MATNIQNISDFVTYKKTYQKEEVKPEEEPKLIETAPDQKSMFGEVTSVG